MIWATILLLAAGTAAIKALGPVALGGRTLPPRLAGVVARLAPSLLAALVVAYLVRAENRTLAVDESAAGALAAVAALAARLPMIAAVVIAAVVTAALRAL